MASSDPFQGLRSVGRWGTVGVEFAVAIGLFTWLGWWADGRFGTEPWLTAVGALVGIGSATLLLVRRALAASEGQPGGARDPQDAEPPRIGPTDE